MGTPLLSGVVFYQEPTTELYCGVKCHGRQSVYNVAFEAIKQKTSKQGHPGGRGLPSTPLMPIVARLRI